MSEKFEVGEVAIWQNLRVLTGDNGKECVVIGGLQMRTHAPFGESECVTELTYRVRDQDGSIWTALPHNLRKKRPPREDLKLVRWADCPWQPEQVRA
jgi:hypothetical protein